MNIEETLNTLNAKVKLIEVGKAHLITSESWFFGPDGQQYRGVYGNCWILQAENQMGFKPTRSTNWYMMVRGETESIRIEGSEVKHMLRTDKVPPKRAQNESAREGQPSYIQELPTNIYILK